MWHGWLLQTHGAGPNIRAVASEAEPALTCRRELDMPYTRIVQTLFNVVRDVCAFIAFSCTRSAALITTVRNQVG